MKRQLCFAGFTEDELAALQPPLAAAGGAWNCVFAPDTDAALAALAAEPFDVVAASLGADTERNAELMREAAIGHPGALRFVLGEAGDREPMIHCMGAPHQFISRPWKAQELVSVIDRSLALDARLANDKLRSFVPRLGRLPALPAIYFGVIKQAESPEATVENIAEVMARDPGPAARLLQLANSPDCGLSEKIGSPAEAVSVLGLEMVKSLMLCLPLFTQPASTGEAWVSLDPLRHHSFRVAKLAARIVLRCIGSERMAGEAYTAGLLHNIGQIVLAANLSREFSVVEQTARNLKCSLREAETKLMGVTASQVGAYLLGLWGMPLTLLESTALHETPHLTASVEFSVLTAVHVANVLEHEQAGQAEGVPGLELDADYLTTLDLPSKTEEWRKFLADPPPNERIEEKSADRCADSETKGARPGRKVLVAAAAAVVAAAAVAAVVLTRGGPQAVQKAVASVMGNSTASPAAPEKPAATVQPKVSPTDSAFDSIKIQGIVYHAGHSTALINGQALDVGERINGVEVVSIGSSNVVLACNGARRTFKLQ